MALVPQRRMKPDDTACTMPPPPPPSRWLVLSIIALGIAIGPLDSAVNIAFPAITKAFQIPLPAIQWVIICYVLTYASLLLGCGRLGDVVGHRRIFLIGLSWSVVSLFLCSQATTFRWFLFFRAWQGLGTALVLSCGPALATLPFPETERGRILGLYNMLYATAYALGPLLGGQLIAWWGWPAVFFFRAPLALLSAILVLGYIRQPAVGQAGQRFDAFGAVMVMLSLASMLLAFNQAQHRGWLAPRVLLLFAGACACLTVFVRHEMRAEEPIIDLNLFRQLSFSIANVSHVLANLASFTILLLVPYYLLNYYRAGSVAGGLLLGMSPLGAVLASPLSGRLLTRFAARQLSQYGLLLIAVGLAAISLWQADTAGLFIAAALMVQGMGLGLFQVANMNFIMGVVPRSHQGVAGSLTILARTIGVVSCATLGSLLLAALQSHYVDVLAADAMPSAALNTQAFVSAFQWIFRAAAAIAAIAAALMWSGRFTSPMKNSL
jgi:EmrB/QacA subfamily drug resistance transporter